MFARHRTQSIRALGLKGLHRWFQRGAETLENVYGRDGIWELWLWTNSGRAIEEAGMCEAYLKREYKYGNGNIPLAK